MVGYKSTKTRVAERVNELNSFSTSAEVADWLIHHGYKGVKGTCSDCPVANAVKDITKNEYYVAVDDYVSVVDVKDESSRFLFEFNTGVFEFIYDFDAGAYPELVLETQ